MAFVQIYAQRTCPQEAFAELEEIIIPKVGTVVYRERYLNGSYVSGSSAHGTLGTQFELDVRVDTEDLPQPGWNITDGGLCVPADTRQSHPKIVGEVPAEGLSEEALYTHHRVQARKLVSWLANGKTGLWTEKFGWDETTMHPKQKIGVLVTKQAGGWQSTAD